MGTRMQTKGGRGEEETTEFLIQMKCLVTYRKDSRHCQPKSRAQNKMGGERERVGERDEKDEAENITYVVKSGCVGC